MNYTLGLDLGSNSTGWALLDFENEKIIDCGVRIFGENVNDELDKEPKNNNVERRNARMRRRIYFRKKFRLNTLIKRLIKYKFLDLYFDKEDWFKLNPYELRAKAISEKVSLYELSRIFYQFAKKRGFLSTRKGTKKDTKIDVNDPKKSSIGIKKNKELAEEFGTIGKYLYSIFPKYKETYHLTLDKIRNRFISREILVDELHKIWNFQKQFYPDYLNDEAFKAIADAKTGIIFYQRPLKSQYHTRANCILEPNKKVCNKSRPEFEEFRIWQVINNLKFNDTLLTTEEKNIVFDLMITSKDTIKIEKIAKKLKKEGQKCNYDDSIPTSRTLYILNAVLDKKYLDNLNINQKRQLFSKLWEILHSFTSDDKIKEYFQKNLPVNHNKLSLLEIPLVEGYASYSLKAINNMLPFLSEGYNKYISEILGGIKNVFGSLWNELADDEIQTILDFVENVTNEIHKRNELRKIIEEYLINNYAINEENLKKLYFSSEINYDFEILDKLPEPPDVKNPAVKKVLTELRKLVNAIIQKYGHPQKIRIELARSLKLTKKDKDKVIKEMNNNEKIRKEARVFLESKNIAVTPFNIQKYILYKEIEIENGIAISPYTLNTISIYDVFADDNRIQIEHIMPYSRTLNDSLANKTLCEAEINQLKGNKTPYEFFGDNPEKWNKIKENIFKILPYQKAKRFIAQEIPDLDNFINRQLNDTRYASRLATKYLLNICKDIEPLTGQVTATLRRLWGLNTILSDDDEKNRTDHRHHAIDAIVIASTDRKKLLEITSNVEKGDGRLKKSSIPPWDNFRNDVVEAIDNILVSHYYDNKIIRTSIKTVIINNKPVKVKTKAVRGQLHNDTIYGRRFDPIDKKYYYYTRKSINGLTMAQIEKIASPEIKNLIKSELKKQNIKVDNKGIPENFVYDIDNEKNIRIPKLFLKNKKGDPVPIFKVRIKENASNTFQLKNLDKSYVEPSNNHHTAIYMNENGDIKHQTVTFWEVVERKRRGQPIYQPEFDGYKLVQTMRINNMFIIGLDKQTVKDNIYNKKFLRPYLYRGQKYSGFDLSFRLASAATLENKEEMIRITSYGNYKLKNPIKVELDILGNITKIYD